MGDSLLFIDGVEDVVGVLLDGGGKDHDFVVFAHLAQELLAVGPYEIDAFGILKFLCVDEGFIHI
jgi:hypothetical protein